MLRTFLGLALALAIGSPAARGALVDDHATALDAAPSTDGIAFLDFFTTWCGPCKAFEKDWAESEDLRTLHGRITLARIDAESEAGMPLARRYQIVSFPTFVAVDASGEELYRWTGYEGPEGFIEEVEAVRADPRTLAARFAAFEAAPTADAAHDLAAIEAARWRYDEALGLLLREIELDPDRAPAVYPVMLVYCRKAVEFYVPVDWDAMSRAADQVLADEATSPGDVVRITKGLRQAAKLDLEPRRYLPWLEPALAVEIDPEDLNAAYCREFLADDHRILVEGDVDGAIADRRAALLGDADPGPMPVMHYAMWCADHAVDLAYARRLLDETLAAGVDDRMLRGLLMSTLADVHFAAGRFDEAVGMLEQTIELLPEVQQLRLQLDYYRNVAE